MYKSLSYGMILSRPHDIGVHNASNEDIKAFRHMWRCYGLEDEQVNYTKV